MLSPNSFHDLVSGRKQGLLPALARGSLRLLEYPYTIAMQRRNRRYDSGVATVHRVEVPVISVGNLTLGGTGKTPFVEWLAAYFHQQGKRVAIVSRGYGKGPEDKNDEALELELALPNVPHVQNADRVAAAQETIESHQTELILLDDGFQHRRLARELDIVLLDATEPWGYKHVFPRGALREPVTGLSRAQVVVLSRADLVDESTRQAIRQRVSQLAPQATWCEVQHCPQVLMDAAGEETTVETLSGKRVAAFCGIGNPRGFRQTVEALNCELVHWREFPDHHAYTATDAAALESLADEAELLLCTRKDLVKLSKYPLGPTAIWSLCIRLKFLAGQEDFVDRLATFQ